MIRAGDTIVNPVTGERLVFELTSRDTDGEYTLFDTYVKPAGLSPRPTSIRTRPRSSPSSRARSA
jgi:hypothetical protein